MRLLSSAALACAIVIGCATAVHAGPPCGSGPGDAPMVASLADAIAIECGCCMPPDANGHCALGMIKPAVRAGRLSRTCARRLLRDTLRACPLSADATACRVCSTDLDCADGEFCDCRAASCGKAGGVCAQRPQVCSQIAAPVCGCDGTTYANDCERQTAGACKRHDGTCVETGGCFDTIDLTCTDTACSPTKPCPLPSQFCTPRCSEPPPTGTCLSLLNRACTTRSCGAGADCLPNEACVPSCPPPPPAGKCVAADGECTDRACGPGQPCSSANQFCNPACLGSPTPSPCASDADCDDGNGCSADHCVNGACEHACICVGPQGASTCCPGPAALCVKPCGGDPTTACGGPCPDAAACMEAPDGDGCACVSQIGGPCGGNIFIRAVCAPGLVCQQGNPDATGVCVDPERPCANSKTCSGPCTRICADGTTVQGTCATGDTASPLSCACTAECAPQPTPTAGPCGGVDACGGSCPLACSDGTTVEGKCILVVVDPAGPPTRPPFGPTCVCLGDCAPPPTPTPGPCGDGSACGGTCPFICPDGSATTGRCLGLPVASGKPGLPGPGGRCACVAQCGPPPTIILPHGSICCQCGSPPTMCFEKHWVEVTPTCPAGCTTVQNGTCDATDSCVPPGPCATDQDCADGDRCTLDRCENGACVHDCMCRGRDSSCHPAPPLGKPDFVRH
jgi:hypothetical protein